MRIKTIAVLLAVPLCLIGVLPADAAPGATQPATQLHLDPKVQRTMQALDRLRSYGYTWTTDAGAAKAIRHWQKVNGLTVDGIVGPETLDSLGLAASTVGAAGSVGVVPSSPATPSKPAVRVPQPTPPPATDGNVEGVIRDVWPDDLEEHALAIARRESNLVPTARNSCCVGLFQIYFAKHRAMLAGLGITSAGELLDARTNARAALALYEVAGWGPWACRGQCVDV